MGSVSRARSDLRRARRLVRKIEEEYAEVIEELGESLVEMDSASVSQSLAGMNRLEKALSSNRSRLFALEDALELAIAERREKRKEAWEEVREALRRFGPGILEVVGDVSEVINAPRADRITLATEALLAHANIAIDPADITPLAKRIVDALED